MKGVNFTKTKSGNLRIKLTREGRAEIRDNPDRSDNAFFNLIEYQLGNGWETIAPEEIGALTDAIIISDECERDDHGDLIKCGRVYSNIDYYQVESDIDRLLRNGELIWKGVK